MAAAGPTRQPTRRLRQRRRDTQSATTPDRKYGTGSPLRADLHCGNLAGGAIRARHLSSIRARERGATLQRISAPRGCPCGTIRSAAGSHPRHTRRTNPRPPRRYCPRASESRPVRHAARGPTRVSPRGPARRRSRAGHFDHLVAWLASRGDARSMSAAAFDAPDQDHVSEFLHSAWPAARGLVHLYIPTDDVDVHKFNPTQRWIYDKLRVAQCSRAPAHGRCGARGGIVPVRLTVRGASRPVDRRATPGIG